MLLIDEQAEAALAGTGRYGEIWGDTGRYGEIRGDMGRYGEIWGDTGRYGEICASMARAWRGGVWKMPGLPSTAAMRLVEMEAA